jgi:hypothetical protein
MDSSNPEGKTWEERNLANIMRIKDAARESAIGSRLPGHISGPNDALRHIIGAAELARQYGRQAAFLMLEANEIRGSYFMGSDGQTSADAAMDRHNNGIGIELAIGANSYEEIVERAKALVAQGIAQNGTGIGGTPMFLQPHLWLTSNSEPDNDPIPEEFLERARNAPPPKIPEPPLFEDPYSTFGRRADTGAGGDVTVAAYTRDDGTRVPQHSRARPARKPPVRGNRPKPKIRQR